MSAQLPIAVLVANARAAGATHLRKAFSGSGDSGDTENMAVEPASVTLPKALYTVLDAWFDQQLDSGVELPANDDGGYGEAVWDLATGKVAVEVNWYELTVGSTDHHELDMQELAELDEAFTDG